MERNLISRVTKNHNFADQKICTLLNFYGVIKDNEAVAVEGAVVMVFACFAGGIERSLVSAFTDRKGAYFISIAKLTNYNGLLGFKVRTGKAYMLPEGVDSQCNLGEHPDEEWVPEQEEILDDETVGALTEHHSDDPVQEGEKDESGNREPDIDAPTADECTNRQEEKGLTVSISRVALNSIPVVVVPTVQTDAATNVSTDSVTLNGSINDTARDNCDQRKFRIRAQGSENWIDADTETGSFGTESFSLTITGLIPGETYEFKAMAHNLAGWGEGNVRTFTAATLPEAPAELTAEGMGRSRSNLRRDALPKETPYDVYRSSYWKKNKAANTTEKVTRPNASITGVPSGLREKKVGSNQSNLTRNTTAGSNLYQDYRSLYWPWHSGKKH